MRKVSLWAKCHKQLARLGIILSFILINIIGVAVGILLHQLQVTFSTLVLSCLIVIFLSAVFLYPSKYEKGKRFSPKKYYVRQKACDLILAASTFCIVIFLANRPETSFLNASFVIHATAINSSSLPADSVKRYKTINSFSASLKDENGKLLKWKERRKLLKEQVREIKKSKDLSDADKILLVVLSVVVAIGLLYLVAVLSCNLSCSGADGAALLVGIGGLALVIFLLVISIRAIYGGKKKPKQTAALFGRTP